MTRPQPRNRKYQFDRVRQHEVAWPWDPRILEDMTAVGLPVVVADKAYWRRLNPPLEVFDSPDNYSVYQRGTLWISEKQEEANVIHELGHHVECKVRRPGRLRNINWACDLDYNKYDRVELLLEQCPESVACNIEVAWTKALGFDWWERRASYLSVGGEWGSDLEASVAQGEEFLRAAGLGHRLEAE